MRGTEGPLREAGVPGDPLQEPSLLAEENPVHDGHLWALGHIQARKSEDQRGVRVVQSLLRFSSLAAQAAGELSPTAAGAYELVVSLWDRSAQRRVRPSGAHAEVKGPAARGPSRRWWRATILQRNPAGDSLYQPRTSQVAMLRRYTVRGERHLPRFLDAHAHTHISRELPWPRAFTVS